ncbi:MAG: NAD-dependent deacylase [Acidobacteriota bacterium]|nr:NAD-dependent deacylase [Acidobacteriota bacterium]
MAAVSIAPTDRVFVLTGAGISAESGLPTFRASDGLWAGYRIEDVCTPEALRSNPADVWAFYSARRENAFAAKPNPGHIALAELERKLGGRYFLCTQNVDDLHERAGSERLLHMHGELSKSRCSQQCGAPPVEDRRIYKSLEEVGRCVCGARLRPHIVFFGEIPLEMPRIERELMKSTVMIVIGTSGSVYPAAGFAQQARYAGGRTIYIGPEPPLNASVFTQSVTGNAAEVLPDLFAVQS